MIKITESKFLRSPRFDLSITQYFKSNSKFKGIKLKICMYMGTVRILFLLVNSRINWVLLALIATDLIQNLRKVDWGSYGT